MNETLETRIRQSIDRQVGTPPLRSMPNGTRTRVRIRQAGAVTAIAAVAVVLTFGAQLALHWAPGGSRPAAGANFEADHPLEEVPSGWPTVRIGDPADGYTMPPDVVEASGPVRVIASGTVEGAGFSFQSYVGSGTANDESGACLGFAGPGLERFASPPPQPPGAVGGISSSTCARAQGVPARFDMYLTSQQDPGQAPGIAANYGFLSDRVARLELRLDDGQAVRIPVLSSPPGWGGLQPFLFFPPEDAHGTLTAYSADGSPLASARVCGYSGTAGGGCSGGGGTTQLAPAPGTS